MPGPRPSPTAAIAQLHAAARRLLRGSVTTQQETVARNLMAALRSVEHLWLGHPHPDDYLAIQAQINAPPAPETPEERQRREELASYIEWQNVQKEMLAERQRLEDEANSGE